ncbi:MAG: prepilin peptidase [Rickettsiales bacterium]|nr:prepilin peptidase [Rickettsiales bacterium]
MIIIALMLIALMLAVFWFDASRFIIPNWLVLCVLALYPIYLLLSPVPIDWIGALGVAVIAFAVGIALFAGNIMGGGDVKLLTACCLWVGMHPILEYIIHTTLIGGVLSIALLAGRPVAGYLWLKIIKSDTMPRLLEKGAPIPYGLAIAGGMLILIAQNKLTGMTLPI